jgi:hypothetical protein
MTRLNLFLHPLKEEDLGRPCKIFTALFGSLEVLFQPFQQPNLPQGIFTDSKEITAVGTDFVSR